MTEPKTTDIPVKILTDVANPASENLAPSVTATQEGLKVTFMIGRTADTHRAALLRRMGEMINAATGKYPVGVGENVRDLDGFHVTLDSPAQGEKLVAQFVEWAKESQTLAELNANSLKGAEAPPQKTGAPAPPEAFKPILVSIPLNVTEQEGGEEKKKEIVSITASHTGCEISFNLQAPKELTRHVLTAIATIMQRAGLKAGLGGADKLTFTAKSPEQAAGLVATTIAWAAKISTAADFELDPFSPDLKEPTKERLQEILAAELPARYGQQAAAHKRENASETLRSQLSEAIQAVQDFSNTPGTDVSAETLKQIYALQTLLGEQIQRARR